VKTLAYAASAATPHKVDAVPRGQRVRRGASPAWIGDVLSFSTAGLESYFFSEWRPDLIDLLVVAAAIEFCDITVRRPTHGWARHFDVRIAIHDKALWDQSSVNSALVDAAGFLTGDLWSFEFVSRQRREKTVEQKMLELNSGARVIMPYSDGLDSRAVAAIVEAEEKNALVRVRLGTQGADRRSHDRRHKPFTSVPYEIKLPKGEHRDSSARSRAFKFAVITGIASRLAGVDRIIVTESGQGALGPVLAVTGHAYPDYRVHPAFTRRMENLFCALFGRAPHYEFPRIWSTKGETLAEASALGTFAWADTRSCWQGSRQTGIGGRRRQCGICAACLLRRMSMHHAKLDEPASNYVWETLSSSTIRGGATRKFKNFTPAMGEYAIAGVLHLDHLAAMAEPGPYEMIRSRVSRELARALGDGEPEVDRKLGSLLARHKAEWLSFVATLGEESFIRKIASTVS